MNQTTFGRQLEERSITVVWQTVIFPYLLDILHTVCARLRRETLLSCYVRGNAAIGKHPILLSTDTPNHFIVYKPGHPVMD